MRTANGWIVVPPQRGDFYPEWPSSYVFPDSESLGAWVTEWARQQEQPPEERKVN
jgi:hypothetical protein